MAAMVEPDYVPGSVSVNPTNGHGLEESRHSWEKEFSMIINTFNQCPLLRQLNLTLTIHEILQKLKGMNGDHANNEKATTKLMEEWKKEDSCEEYGTERLLEMGLTEVIGLLGEWRKKMVEEEGRIEAWNLLSAIEQAAQDENMMKCVKQQLGEEYYETLDMDMKQSIDLFFWYECCMHKDQNSFKAGNTAMIALWEKQDIEGPVLLANKANATAKATLTEDKTAALEASTHGGAKMAAIAGVVFKNRDKRKEKAREKKKAYTRYMQNALKKKFRQFPDMSHNRSASHGDAAECEVDKKNPGFTNIKKNLLAAMKCPRTLEELAVLALIHQSITISYL
ncbi:hypothetical protein K435DRAFT_802407 [Dendrothele bispora CBS 962.96]|uniref:Uncharacterized protein n=1 Tax=Dendrothele bispora (strain CBS 962.96) TaxID=1314807 RepID=A0A4S8LL34_DENBC|nr:hypothetical protein K435DRAFT_802407 [Dendrothele bispora CBS 962.96]